MPSPQQCFEIEEYMFCHPEDIELRKGSPKVMRWKHLINPVGLFLNCKYDTQGKCLVSIDLYATNDIHLETLSPLWKFSTRDLRIQRSGKWLSFKWTTSRGTTQFQISSSEITVLDTISDILQCSNFPVINKSWLGERYLEDGVEDTRLEQHLMQTQTQVEESPGLIYEDHTIKKGINLSSDLGTPDVGESTKSLGSAEDYESTIKEFPELNESLNKPIHLHIESYSQTEVPRHQVSQFPWKLMGLVSGMALSLIPKTHESFPKVILSHECDIMTIMLVDSRNLRVFGANNVVVLSALEPCKRTKYMLQLTMNDRNVAIISQWLKIWGIQVQSPLAAIPRTDTTALVVSMQTQSACSFGSDDSCYWKERERPTSGISRVSRESHLSRVTELTGLSNGSRLSIASKMSRSSQDARLSRYITRHRRHEIFKSLKF